MGTRALPMELPKLDTAPELPPFRILCLDGGGIRGYSSLLILREIMVRFNKKVLGRDDSENLPLISELFDIVVGTSTGGLIALMLTKLGMTVDECIEQYKVLSQKIFGEKRSWRKRTFSRDHSKYSGDDLRQFIVDLMQDRDDRFKEKYRLGDKIDDSEGYRSLPNVACSVVCRRRMNDWSQTRAADPIFLCSHRGKLGAKGVISCYGCKVADAARATSAAPTYFASIEVNGMDLVDGGYGDTNNPSYVAFEHYRRLNELPKRRPVAMINIGTGTGPDDVCPKEPWWWRITPDPLCPYFNIVNDSIHLLTRSEEVGKRMKFLAENMDGFFFERFSANTGVHDIELDDWTRVNDPSDEGIAKLTATYLSTISGELDAVVERLYQGHMRKKRASQAALQQTIDDMARSPISSPERETVLPQLRPQNPLATGDNPGLRGPSEPTDEAGPPMPRTPVSGPSGDVEVVDSEQEVPSVGTQFLAGQPLSPPPMDPSSPRPSWSAIERKTSRVSTYPSRSSGSQLHEH